MMFQCGELILVASDDFADFLFKCCELFRRFNDSASFHAVYVKDDDEGNLFDCKSQDFRWRGWNSPFRCVTEWVSS
jgi:hypothetical protein